MYYLCNELIIIMADDKLQKKTECITIFILPVISGPIGPQYLWNKYEESRMHWSCSFNPRLLFIKWIISWANHFELVSCLIFLYHYVFEYIIFEMQCTFCNKLIFLLPKIFRAVIPFARICAWNRTSKEVWFLLSFLNNGTYCCIKT